MGDEKIYDWSLLNRECADIVTGVLDEWKQLLKADESESDYQRFLARHAGLFFNLAGSSLAISQVQLGSELRPDLVIVSDGRSAGPQYKFVELEKPSDPPYIERGVPSKKLNEALQQVRDWQRWLEDNREASKKIFPAKHSAGRSVSYTIIIGRRDNTNDWLPERNQFGNDYKVHVRSYDYLTDILAQMQFAHSCSWVEGDPLTLNQLANPFWEAFTDSSWRELMRKLERSCYEGLDAYSQHFLTGASKEVLQQIKYNSLFEEFSKRNYFPPAR